MKLTIPLKYLSNLYSLRAIGMVLLCIIGSVSFAQTNCIKKKPKTPYPNSIDTLCVGDPSPSLGIDIRPDSVGFQIQWATDTTQTPTTVPPSISTVTSTTTSYFARQNRTSTPTCSSAWEKFTWTVLPKPPAIKILPMPPAPMNRKLNVCEGYSANLSDSLVKQAGYFPHWYALDASGNKVVFNGIISKAKYIGADTIFYVQNGGPGYCFGDTLQVHVAVLPKPVLKVNPVLGYTICEGKKIPFNALTQHQGYKPTYDWYVNYKLVAPKSGPNFSIDSGVFKGGDSVKVYYVIHIDRFAPYYHCDSVGPPWASDTVNIRILPKSKVPGIIYGPYIVYQGQKNVFYRVGLDTTLAYKWRFSNPATGSNNSVKPDGTLNYALNTATVSYSDSLNFTNNKEIIDTITLVVQNVCDSAKEILIVHIRPYLKPINILTPNGDNINDIWVINNIDNEAYSQNLVMVYDRFGNLVFKQANYSNAGAWNGNYKGNPLSEGTYYYIIQYHEDTFLKSIKGYLTILRGR